MTDWLKEAEQLQDELVEIRRLLHQDPERGNREVHTSAFLEKYLNDLGIETERMLETAVVGTLRGGKPGRTVAFRSDMDALPIQEDTGLPFASKNPGVMHACGHDLHMTALLGCAKLLAAHRDEINGTVKFFLQPDEEEDGGAERMIACGVLEGVDAVFGAHVNPDLKAGTIGVKYGKFYASCIKFDVTVHGKGCHGAEPENGIDALYAAAQMCISLKNLTTNRDGIRRVVTVGTLQAGTARNIVTDTAYFTGIARTQGVKYRDEVKENIEKVIHAVEEETGVTADVDITYGYPGVDNHDEEVHLVEDTCRRLLGNENTIVLEEGTMTSEDFGYFLLERPGCFYHIGVESEAGLHSPQFNPKESALSTAAAVHAAVLTEYLNQKS